MKYLKVSNIKLHINEPMDTGINKAIKLAGISQKEVISWELIKSSIDARKKPELYRICTYGLIVKKYNKKKKNIQVLDEKPRYKFIPTGINKMTHNPIVVGFGPAGMFNAYMLAKFGYNPIIIERGSKVDTRIKKVEQFWDENILDEQCNVLFGEGGAGTFSDGKLNTGIKDKENRINLVLETFVKFGADSNILSQGKPHIGTDILEKIVKNMREYIIQKGGRFYFDTTLTGINYTNNNIKSIEINHKDIIDCDCCILAIGHSARDTFEMLNNKHVSMESKPFAIGVRVEHKQEDINESLYGMKDSPIGAASYKLTYKCNNGRGVYSFCMCPGGYVVNSSSEKGMLSINGMSYSNRDSKNSNSAIVVTITPKDFKTTSPLSGIEFQRNIERKAFNECKGLIPAQKYIDFKNNILSTDFSNIIPVTKGDVAMGNLNNIFPKYILESITMAIEHFGNIIKGFNSDDTILTAVESRTSSPVRIIRNDKFQSNINGLYPTGEGAGYAGGITSAAIDGIKIFEYIASTYKPIS